MSVNNGRRIQFEGGPAGLVQMADGTVQLAYQLRDHSEARRAGEVLEVDGAAHTVLSYANSKVAKNMVVLTLKKVEAQASS